MPSRKSKAAALDTPQSESSTFSSTLDSSAPSSARNLRRSGRNILQPSSEKDGDHEKRSGEELAGRMMGKDANGHCLREGKEQEEGVKMAIEGLARMERRLQRATKRQKKQLEEDGIPVPSVVSRFPTAPYHHKSANAEEREAKEPVLKTHSKDVEGEAEIGVDDVVKMEPAATNIIEPEDAQDAAERGAARPPAVNSSYLPLPWKGRLGYACLNTYLRNAKPPIFSSRTCRMASIVDHRHPLQFEDEPEHHLKNKPDKSKEPQDELGHKFLQELGLANARDIVKMLRWNEKYGIRFLRLSSEMFPFASHPVHGYKLAPFASEVLAEAGRVAAELGHRLTTHPGQFTQLGSPRKEVVESAIRDLEYHDELLSLLKLPEQQNRDAVMIIHMGGQFGDKAATLERFKKNYARLSQSCKNRLVLENDDVGWTVHDLLPVCEELNIPMVLDYHHHNICFDPAHLREGTLDISDPKLQERIANTWKRKGIKQKMHYSEPCDGAVTPRDRRKHRPRVMTLPPCPPDMDLMIEAKDKEQAVFELMRTFKLPGFEKINDMVPYDRDDENRPAPPVKAPKKKKGGKRKRVTDEEAAEPEEVDTAADDVKDAPEGPKEVPEEERAMGGPFNRVYWPLGCEEWLKPKKREVKKGKVPEEVEDEGEFDG
ncbi:UV-endonuclease UvdE-domain-containing protein [Neurospora hispaniola]|uniref:UV-endonuclease UvdE-domain-containing protein n=1 Tax=Neurospora hispaniola TaxID=588809 RepID=A0AAJ0IE91_9PEZI|nr:UV-endonuclease UvdE-domain-containing protein [Neurospora hispaniola]